MIFLVSTATHTLRAVETSTIAAPAIRLNTIGYRPETRKQATVLTSGEEFVVRDTRKDVEVMRGRLSPLKLVSASDGPLAIADFSAVDREGDYKIVIAGNDSSCDFRVAKDIYNWPFYGATRAMYLWRCGTEVSAELGGRRFEHAACHMDDAYLDHVGGPAGKHQDGTGGWHDAGDYNKYTVNSAFTLGMMLQAWEHFRDKLAPLKLDIPESGKPGARFSR